MAYHTLLNVIKCYEQGEVCFPFATICLLPVRGHPDTPGLSSSPHLTLYQHMCGIEQLLSTLEKYWA